MSYKDITQFYYAIDGMNNIVEIRDYKPTKDWKPHEQLKNEGLIVNHTIKIFQQSIQDGAYCFPDDFFLNCPVGKIVFIGQHTGEPLTTANTLEHWTSNGPRISRFGKHFLDFGWAEYVVNQNFVYKNSEVTDLVIAEQAFCFGEQQMEYFQIETPNATMHFADTAICITAHTGSDLNAFILRGKILKANDGGKVVTIANLGFLESDKALDLAYLCLEFDGTEGNGWALFNKTENINSIRITNCIRTNIPSLINSNSIPFKFDTPTGSQPQIYLDLDKAKNFINIGDSCQTFLTNITITPSEGTEEIIFGGTTSYNEDIYINIVSSNPAAFWRDNVAVTRAISSKQLQIENKAGNPIILEIEDNPTFSGSKYTNCTNTLHQEGKINNNDITFDFGDGNGTIPSQFMQNTAIEKLEIISQGTVLIGTDAFKGCKNLTDITINSKLEENRNSNISSFSKGAESITLRFGENVYSIPPGYFGNMNIGSLDLSSANNLDSIQDYSFQNSIINIINTCPPLLRSISKKLFEDQYGNSSITKSNCVTAWTRNVTLNGKNYFDNDYADFFSDNGTTDEIQVLQFSNANGGYDYWLLEYIENNPNPTGMIEDLAFLVELPIKGIAQECFMNKTLVLKNASNSLEKEIWTGNANLMALALQNSTIQSIEDRAFYNCKLTDIDRTDEQILNQNFISFDFPNLHSIGKQSFYFEIDWNNQRIPDLFYYINGDKIKNIYGNSLCYIKSQESLNDNIISIYSKNKENNKNNLFLNWCKAFILDDELKYKEYNQDKNEIECQYKLSWQLIINGKNIDTVLLGGTQAQFVKEIASMAQEIEFNSLWETIGQVQDNDSTILVKDSDKCRLGQGCLLGNSSIGRYCINLDSIIIEKMSLGPFNRNYVGTDRALIFMGNNEDAANKPIIFQKIMRDEEDSEYYDEFTYIRLPIFAYQYWFAPKNNNITNEDLDDNNLLWEFAYKIKYNINAPQIYSVYTPSREYGMKPWEEEIKIYHRIFPVRPTVLYLPRLTKEYEASEFCVLNVKYANSIEASISPFVGLQSFGIDSGTTIPDEYCSDLSTLTKVVINKTKNLGIGCFYNCDQLKEVQLLGNLETIGQNSFYNCKNLQVLKLASTLKAIRRGAFNQCNSLNKIYFFGSAEDWYNIKFYDLGASPFYNSRAQNHRYYFGENLGEWYDKELTITTRKKDLDKDSKLYDYDYYPFYGYTIKGLRLGYLLKDGLGIVERVSDEEYANAQGIQYIVFTENSMNDIIDYKDTNGKNYILSEQIKPDQVDKGKYPRLCGIMLDPNLTELPESFLQGFKKLSDHGQVKIGIPADKIEVLEKDSLSNCFWPLIQLNEGDLKENELIKYINDQGPTSCSFANLKYSNDCGLQSEYQQTNGNLKIEEKDIDGEKSKKYIFFANGQKNFLVYIDNVTWGKDVPEYLDNLSVINQGCIGNKDFTKEKPGKDIQGCYIDTLYLPWIGSCKDTSYIPSSECFTLWNLLANKQATRIGELTLGNSTISHYFEPKGKIDDNQRVFQGIIFGKIDKNDVEKGETRGKVIFAFDQIIGEIANRNHFDDTHTRPNEENKLWQFDVTVKMKKVPSHLLTRDEQGGEKRWKLHIHNLKFEPVEKGTKNNYVLQSHSVATELIDNIYFEQLKNDNDTLTFENEAFQGVMRANNPPDLLCNHIYFNRPLEEWYQRVNYGATNSNPAQYALELHSENSEGDYEVRREISPSCEKQIVDGKTIYKFIMKNYCLEKNRQIDSIDLYKNLPADKPNNYEVMLVNNINDFSSSTDFGDLSYGLIEVFSGTPHLNNSELQANKFRKNQTETTKESEEKE